MSSQAAALTFDKHGEPAAVLQLGQQRLPELGEADVHLQILAVSAFSCSCIQSHIEPCQAVSPEQRVYAVVLPRPPSTLQTSTLSKASTPWCQSCLELCQGMREWQRSCRQAAR